MNRQYQIVILDDESLITQGLSQTIDWAAIGCRVACTGNDGEKGLRLIEQYRPDILITDIIMPGKTGLELSQYVQQHLPQTRVILLTAYEDFEFARTAIRYGVSHYIVKPMDKAQIIQAVSSVVDELRQADLQQQAHKQIQTIAQQARPIISQSILFDSALFGLRGDRSDQMPEDFFDPDYQSGSIALIRHPFLEGEMDSLISFSIRTHLDSLVQSQGVKCIHKQLDGVTLVIFALDHRMGPQAFQHHIRMLLQALLDDIAVSKALICHASQSGIYHTPQQMHGMYMHALDQLERCYFHYQPGVVEVAKTPGAFHAPSLDELMELVSLGNTDKARAWWNKTVQALAGMQQAPQTVEWLRQTMAALRGLTQKYPDLVLPKEPHQQLTVQGNFYDQQAMLWRMAEQCCQYFQSRQSLSGRIQAMTERGFSQSDFSLRDISRELDLNQSYLSRMFKKQTGIAFSQYLTQLRIDRAKHLLRFTQLKNYEIAQQIGFSDEHYFSKVFKQRCDMTPSQYRAMHSGQRQRQ